MDRMVLGALVAVLALGVASCGGSGTLSRADFTKQANAICKSRSARIQAAERNHRGNFRAAVLAALPAARKGLDELKALKPPSELKAKYEQLMASERAQIERISNALAGHGRGQNETANDAHTRTRLQTELGLTSCI